MCICKESRYFVSFTVRWHNGIKPSFYPSQHPFFTIVDESVLTKLFLMRLFRRWSTRRLLQLPTWIFGSFPFSVAEKSTKCAHQDGKNSRNTFIGRGKKKTRRNTPISNRKRSRNSSVGYEKKLRISLNGSRKKSRNSSINPGKNILKSINK